MKEMKTVVIYGSTTGTTEAVAQDVAGELGAVAIAAADADAMALDGCNFLVLGASMWGMGDLQDDMADFISRFESMDVTATCGAVFGLGDQVGFSDSFVDGIADMAGALAGKGLNLVGDWPADGYAFSASRAQDGTHFSGLALDQDNEPEKTADRIVAWVLQLKKEVQW
ncbi:flavodoxin [Pontiellaceae bacterium B12219]|nr:flavodoxin [Pontiellaceae bacterium B12219]